MRAILLRITLEPFWNAEIADGVPHLGFGWVLLPWLLAGLQALRVAWKRDPADPNERKMEMLLTAGTFLGLPILVFMFLPAGLRKEGIPVFGYGFMMFVGIVLATFVALRNAKRAGLKSDSIMDLSMWLIIPGIIGARLFYIVQYRDQVFAGKRGMGILKAAINLPDGGLVFYGCVIAGLGGFLAYCYRRKLNVLLMGDIIVPSLMVGLACGRIGCFLYGCCFGDTCSLPWAVEFPKDSVPYTFLLNHGFIDSTASLSLPLHPTQIYSSISAALLAVVLILYFRNRPKNGAVLAVGWVLYPITRFILEFLRADEVGQLGTSLTISQWISLGLFVSGLVYSVALMKWKGGLLPRTGAAPAG